MSKTNLNIFDRFYVGVQSQKPLNTEYPPLAFATQVGTDAAWLKRKNTVDRWAGYAKSATSSWSVEQGGYVVNPAPEQTEEGFYFDNEPTSGFYFEKSVTRWRTSNKWFAINDPRGFQLQISAENLGDILINSHISKGMLVGKFLWAKDGQNIYLCREDHPSYLHHISPPVARETKALKVGDVVTHGSATEEYVFAGKKYCLAMRTKEWWEHNETKEIISREEYYSRTHMTDHWGHYRGQNPEVVSQYTQVQRIMVTKDLKPVQAFKPIKGSNYHQHKFMRTNGKYKVMSEGHEVPEYSDFVNKVHGPLYFSSAYKVFDTKKELVDYTINLDDMVLEYLRIEPQVNHVGRTLAPVHDAYVVTVDEFNAY